MSKIKISNTITKTTPDKLIELSTTDHIYLYSVPVELKVWLKDGVDEEDTEIIKADLFIQTKSEELKPLSVIDTISIKVFADDLGPKEYIIPGSFETFKTIITGFIDNKPKDFILFDEYVDNIKIEFGQPKLLMSQAVTRSKVEVEKPVPIDLVAFEMLTKYQEWNNKTIETSAKSLICDMFFMTFAEVEPEVEESKEQKEDLLTEMTAKALKSIGA